MNMNGFLLGTVIIIAAALLRIPIWMSGISPTIGMWIVISIAVTGFAIQMYSAFSTHFSFRREMRAKQTAHEALMEKAKTLPPDQAIALLLGRSVASRKGTQS